MPADERPIDLSIVIVSFNTLDLLRRCLRTIDETVRGFRHEIVVVDNGSTDGSAEAVAREHPAAVLIRNRDNRGFARANNQGIAASRGRHTLLLNSDALLLEGTVERMIGFLDRNPAAGAVGGQLFNPDGSFQASYNDFPNLLTETLLLTGLSRWLLPRSFPSYPEHRSQTPRQVDWVGGALLMVRRRAIDQVGGLDEDYFMYAEEMDWCVRLNRSGWPVYYLPDAKAIHWLGGSSRRVPERRRAMVYGGRCLFMRKHHGWLYAATFRQLIRLFTVLKLAAWAASGFVAGTTRRERAHQQVASYRFLLANL